MIAVFIGKSKSSEWTLTKAIDTGSCFLLNAIFFLWEYFHEIYKNKYLFLAPQTFKTLKDLFLEELQNIYGIEEILMIETVYKISCKNLENQNAD